MKALTTAIYNKKSGSSLDSLLGGRFFKGRSPGGAQYPYLVFMMVSNTPEDTFTEKIENALIQFSIFSSASGTTEIEDIYSALCTLYDDCSLSITGEQLLSMRRISSALIPEDHSTPSGTQAVWHYAVDYDVLIKRN